jgi:uracil-DNA glycosylase
MSLKRKATDAALSDAKKTKANGSITSFFGPPKTVSTSTKPASTAANITNSTIGKIPSSPASITTPGKPFDKEAWVKTLTAEQKDLLALEIGTLHESWLKELKNEITSKEFLDLKRFLKKEHESGKQIFPPAMDVYSWCVAFPILKHPQLTA